MPTSGKKILRIQKCREFNSILEGALFCWNENAENLKKVCQLESGMPNIAKNIVAKNAENLKIQRIQEDQGIWPKIRYFAKTHFCCPFPYEYQSKDSISKLGVYLESWIHRIHQLSSQFSLIHARCHAKNSIIVHCLKNTSLYFKTRGLFRIQDPSKCLKY